MASGKYKSMNTVLERINRDYVSLPERETRMNNVILGEFMEILISRMKTKDILFAYLFNRVFYGGSYYDGLKVGHPNEYDLDLLFNLNKICETEIIPSGTPGYVHLKLKRKIGLMKPDLFTGDLLDNQKVRSWMESVVSKTLNESKVFKLAFKDYFIVAYKSGPAITLRLYTEYDDTLEIDLVPCFEFQWAKCPYIPQTNNTSRTNVFIVPKPFKSDTEIYHYHFWRLSFQEQERDLLNGKQFLKPAIKLIKKMRDKLQHKDIASYFIKTVALWENDNNVLNYWNTSLSEVFMVFLKSYYNYLVKQKIPFYWYPNNNLLGNLDPRYIENIKNRINRVISDIDNHLEDPYVVIKYLLTKEEFERFKREHIHVESVQGLRFDESVESGESTCIIF